MQPDNEEIIKILAHTQGNLRETLVELTNANATTGTLYCIIEAMQAVNRGIGEMAEPMGPRIMAVMQEPNIGLSQESVWAEFFRRLEAIEKNISQMERIGTGWDTARLDAIESNIIQLKRQIG